MLNLVEEFRSIVETLESEKIEYAICGGMAMAIHGFIRATIDIDIVLLNENILKLKKILQKQGYLLESEAVREWNYYYSPTREN